MSELTDNPADPRLGRGVDAEPAPQNAAYLVLSEAERAAGYQRPLRLSYEHTACTVRPGAVTTMSMAIAETYARDPAFYGATYCCACNMHRPVGADGEFVWAGSTERVGT